MYKFRKFYLVLLIPAIWAIGYGTLHLLAYIFPLEENNTLNAALYSIIVVSFGLIIPYLMLKVAFHKAHLRNSHEKELELKDLPIDQDKIRNAH